MKHTMNITATQDDMDRFQGPADLDQYCRSLGLDGLELMPCGCEEIPALFPPQRLIGLHLRFYSSWLDFWQGNEQALLQEYGSRQVWEQFYGAKNREELLQSWRQELDLAQKAGVQYVVFHVAECTLGECLTYRPLHADEEVCDNACQIINALLDGRDYDFDFLVENLWWSGFTFTKPAVTKRLLDGIHYQKKGIMLDTGHLLHTNLQLQTQSEGIAWIHRMLDEHKDLCRYIKGMHLNQSITGKYVLDNLKNPMALSGGYWDRLGQIYPYIFNIDQHKPFSEGDLKGLVDRIGPEFVTHEFITCSRAQQEQALRTQLSLLK